MRIVLVPRTGRLTHGIDPDVAGISVTRERWDRGDGQAEPDRGGNEDRSS